MNKTHYSVLFAALALFLLLYLGFDTKTDKQKMAEQSRSLQAESTSLETLLADAKEHLEPAQLAQVTDLENQIEAGKTNESRLEGLKKLSGLWYRLGQLPVSGGIAEQVAELENTDTAWSVAGATFYSGLVGSQDQTLRSYCAAHAVKAFENAASLKPENPEHRVNLALVYAENPPPDNPMQAVLMLRDLEKKHPEDPAVYNALGRLAIKTGQWERAIERLEKAWSLSKTNPNTPCLLAKAYEATGNNIKAQEFGGICNNR